MKNKEIIKILDSIKKAIAEEKSKKAIDYINELEVELEKGDMTSNYLDELISDLK